MTEELKPCAHCGSDCLTDYSAAAYYPADVPCTPSTEIQCDECKVTAPSRVAWNRRASPWIRVEDGLPEHYQDVLIKLVCCSDSIISATWHGIDNHFFSNVSGHDYPDATHWMPIPKLPEEK